MDRRSFLKLLGVAGAAVVAPELVVEPRRKFWQVSRAAPVDVGAAMRAYATLDSIPTHYFEDRNTGLLRRQLLTNPPVKQLSYDDGLTWWTEPIISPNTLRQSMQLDLDDLSDQRVADTIDKFREVMAGAIDDDLSAMEQNIVKQLTDYPGRAPCSVCGRLTGGCCTRKRPVFRAEIKIDGLDLSRTFGRRHG